MNKVPKFNGTPGLWNFTQQHHATKESGLGMRYGVYAQVIDVANREEERWLFNIALDKTIDPLLHKEAFANGMLIAAAPELLAALINARDTLILLGLLDKSKTTKDAITKCEEALELALIYKK